MRQSLVIAVFSFLIFYLASAQHIEVERRAFFADFLAHEGMQLAEHPLNKCRVVRRVFRVREIFHLAGVVHEVVQSYVARRV